MDAHPQISPLSPLFQELLKHYPPVLSLDQAAHLLNFPSVNAVRVAVSRGRFPVLVKDVGGRRCLFLRDCVDFLESGIPQVYDNTKETKKRGRGRPTKAQQKAQKGGAA